LNSRSSPKNVPAVTMKRTGTDNPELRKLIGELKRLGSEKKVPLWQRVAYDLERPSRNRRIVNLSRINRFSKEGETIVVPGKVLGSGTLDHKLTIAAFTFSKGAIEQIEKSNAIALTISDFMKQDIKGKRVRIVG